MPAEYMECVRSEMKDGKDRKSAQKMCSISYYKRHGRTPQQDEHKDSKSELTDSELDLLNRILGQMFDEIEAAKKRKRNDKKETKEE